MVLGAVAVGIWMLLRTSMPATVGPPDIRPITSDEVPADLPIILAWEGGGPPYRVRLTDEAGKTLWHSPKLARALVMLPQGLRRGLVAGSSYRWSVEGWDLRGKPYRSQAFPLRLAPPTSVPAPVSG